MTVRAKLNELANVATVGKIEVENVGTIYLRKLTVGDARRIAEGASNTARAFQILACDEKGGEMYLEDEIDAIDVLPINLVRRVVEAGMRANGFDDDDEEPSGNA